MNRLAIIACVIGFGLLSGELPLCAEIAPELQEPGVLYFEGNLPAKITARVQASTTLYLQRDFGTALAALQPGSEVEVVGEAKEGYLLKGVYRNNSVTGWVRVSDLPTGIDPAFFAQAEKMQAHRDAVAVAITNKTAIKDMTPDEVQQAVGRPEQTASRTDAGGTVLTWTYVTYREEPQYSYVLNAFGRAVPTTYYVKVPIGQLVVNFENGAVATIEEHKTDPSSPGVVTN